MHPVKNLFSAVFFVSVGMMIDPAILYEYAGSILIFTFLTVFIKFWGTGMGALLAGCSIRNSMCAGLSMAQIGEFAFIIATLGKSLGVISDFLYPVAVATSAITTLTTPYLIMSSGPISRWLDNFIPEKVGLWLLRYEVVMNESVGHENVMRLFVRTHGLAITLNAVVVVGIILGAPLMVADVYSLSSASLPWLILTIFVASPFLWGILRGMPPHAEHHDTETLTRLQQLQFGIATIRFLLGTAMVAFFVSNFKFAEFPILSGFASVAGIVGFLFICDRPFGWFYHRIESRFVSHLSDKERSVVEDRAAMAHMVPWEATLTEFTLSEYSPLVMKTLLDSNLKQKFGVTVAVI
jgi:CPA2 family monovalent cation:H+ antiporter-2